MFKKWYSMSALLGATALMLAVSQGAHAVTGVTAGTVLTNDVEVVFSDASGTVQCTIGVDCPTDSVDVTVTLIPDIAWSTPAPQAETVSSGDATGNFVNTLTNVSNGSILLDIDIILGTPSGTLNNRTGDVSTIATVTDGTTSGAAAGTINNGAEDNTLGGTNWTGVAADDSGDPGNVAVIPVYNLVPADFNVGDKVVIAGTVWTVASGSTSTGLAVDISASDLATLNIDLGAIGEGGQIGEQIEITLSLANAGELAALGGDITYDIDYDAKNAADYTGGAFTETLVGGSAGDSITITIAAPNVSVTKLVRNTTTAALNAGGAGSATPLAPGTNTYFASGVEGQPGDVLEYILVVNNTGGGDSGNTYVTDTWDEYTTLNTVGTGGQDISVDLDGCDSTGFEFLAADGQTIAGSDEDLTNAGGVVTTTGGTTDATATGFTVYLGTGADETAGVPAGGGALAATTGTACVVYRVTIQ